MHLIAYWQWYPWTDLQAASICKLFLSVDPKVCVRRWCDEISCKTTDPARGHTQTQTGIYKKHTHCADSGTFQTTVGQEREGQELIICSLGTGNSYTEETILTPTVYRCLASPLNSTSNICFWEFNVKFDVDRDKDARQIAVICTHHLQQIQMRLFWNALLPFGRSCTR